MRKKLVKAKALVATSLAIALSLQPFSLVGFAGNTDPVYKTELESDVGLIDGQPGDGMLNKHYYGGTYADNVTVAPPSSARLGIAASYGNGNTTAYKFGWIKQGSSGSFLGWKFDFNGIIDKTVLSQEPSAENEEAFYVSDQGHGGALSITYPSSDPQGFNTTVGYGVKEQTVSGSTSNQASRTIEAAVGTVQLGTVQTKRSASNIPADKFYPSKDGEWRNGETVKVFDGSEDLKLEVRLSVKPSDDKKYILTEYTVYNANTNASETNPKIVDEGRTDGGRTVWFSAGTDIMIAGHDGAPVWSTEKTERGNKIEGLHGQSNDGSRYTLASFDLLTHHPQMNLGIQKRDESDPSKLTTWVGHYTEFASNTYTDLEDTSYMPNGTNSSLDSGLAYSMRFDLLPGETKTGTFAWSMKGPTYYVDPVNGDDNGGNGHMGSPYRSVKRALEIIRQRNPEIVFINVMGDIEINEALIIPAGKDITISTTDYVKDSSTNSKVAAYPIVTDSNNIRTNQFVIRRGSSYNGDLFKLEDDNSALRLTDIIIDGNNSDTSTGALINAKAGTIDLQTGSILRNNKINKIPESFTDDNANGIWDDGESFVDTNANGKWDNFVFAASAIELTGSASFGMSTGGVVRDNISYQGAAINKNSTGKFTLGDLRNKAEKGVLVLVTDNVNAAGAKANTKFSIEKDNAGVITGEANKVNVLSSITTDSIIGLGIEKPPVNRNTGVPIVEYPANLTYNPYSVTNFPSDKAPGLWPESARGDYLELWGNEYSYQVEYVKEENGANIHKSVSANYITGTEISSSPVDLINSGYVYAGYEILPANNHGLSIDDNGNVSGYMPSENLNIIYKYKKNAGIFKFIANGGIASANEIVSTAGMAANGSLPTASRTGYDFEGWFEMIDVDADGQYTEGIDTLAAQATTSLPNPVEIGTKIYVAKWRVSSTTYLFTVNHKNSNAKLPIKFKSNTSSKKYLSDLSENALVIPGYLGLSQQASPQSMGKFDSNAEFRGTMPLGQAELNYKYRVDTNVRFVFKVEHYDTNGNELQAATILNRPAETPITARPMTALGYQLVTKAIMTGDTGVAPVMKVSEMIPASGDAVGFGADNMFKAYMPNQDVTIRYTYQPTSDYYVVQKYIDSTDGKRIGNVTPNPYTIGATINLPYTTKYGYTYGSGVSDNTTVGNFNANGDFNGTMIANNINLTYNLNRDPNYWKTITYAVAAAPHNKGVISSPASFTFLKNDGSAEGNKLAHTFEKIKELGNIAVPTGNPLPYYMFEGWYKDSEATIPVTDDMTFEDDVTVYAKFVENPDYWIDINFAAASHGQISESNTLHTYYDNAWGDISGEIPTYTPEVNYLFDKWTVDESVVNNNTVLENGKTYFANFKKDPVVWGINVGHFDPVGSLADNGKGLIKVSGVYKDNIYVVTDLGGKIVDVIKASADGVIKFENLYPGSRYNVHEGSPDTVATKGTDISTVTGTSLSPEKQVLIPAVDTNYNIGYDPSNEGRVAIIVNPADPDSDYALIDENGNIVLYPDSDNGWKHSSDINNPKVIFGNLEPNATYTVVARKKGDLTKTPQEKLPEGTNIIANPGDEFKVPKYVIETKGGMVETVGDVSIDLSRYEEVKKGEKVSIHADLTNANGSTFKYWLVMNGHNTAFTEKIRTNDFSFIMEATNLVLKAVYEKYSNGTSLAEVEEEVRGGSPTDFATDPNSLERLETDLTTGDDKVLIDVNGADVRYKVVYNKRNVSNIEKEIVREISESGINHSTAHTSAWALDISVDRYVDGRKVDRATTSEAPVRVSVQLNAKDVDMLDYQLFDVTTSTPVEMVPISGNPETNYGLFEFEGNLNHKYVLVYSKIFKLTFVDNTPALDHLYFNDLTRNFLKILKIRRGESVLDNYYTSDYADVLEYADADRAGALVTPFDDIYGTQYDYVNWSTKESPSAVKVFDLDTEIKKHIIVYAYYNNNKPKVQKARVDLGSLIDESKTFSVNPFINQNELDELNAEIERAEALLAKHRGDELNNLRQANYPELKAAFDALKLLLDNLRDKANNTRTNYLNRTGGGSGGGSGSSGRGAGSVKRPLEGTVERSFFLGVNGNWSIDPVTGKYRYTLYGGMPLNNRWGKIQTVNERGKLVTDWYFFDDKSNMVTGWFKEERTNTWYYLNPVQGMNNGKMLTGWFKDHRGDWYYLDLVSGAMYRGWHLIGEHWYYFAPYNMADGKIEGSLYVNTSTPDGYKVNGNGEWIK